MHPSPELLAQPLPSSATLALRGSMQHGMPDAGWGLTAMIPSRPSLSLGMADGPTELVFGSIGAVEQDPFGRLLVLDTHAQIIRVFDGDGRLLPSVGGLGLGPGELSGARSLLMLPDQAVLVLEGRGRASRFRAGVDTIGYSDLLQFGMDLWDACVLGDRLVVHGMRPGGHHAFHAFTLGGEPLFSFGEAYSSPNPIIRHQLSRGRVACVEELGEILHAPAHLPQLRAYDRSGELVWWMEMEDFAPFPVWETSSGASVMERPGRPWHSLAGIVAPREQSVALLQVAEVDPGTGGSEHVVTRFHTFVISAGDRDARYLGDTWPRVLAWRDNLLLATRQDPHPQVLLFRLRHRPGPG